MTTEAASTEAEKTTTEAASTEEETITEAASTEEETTTEASSTEEETTTEAASTEEEATTEASSTEEEATTEEVSTEKEAVTTYAQTRNVTFEGTLLESGNKVNGTANDGTIYMFQPKKSGFYYMSLQPENEDNMSVWAKTFYYTQNGEELEENWFGYCEVIRTVEGCNEKVFYMNANEKYEFHVNADKSTAYSLLVSEKVTIQSISTKTNPVNSIYKYIDYEGLRLDILMSDGYTITSEVDSYLYDNNSYAYIKAINSIGVVAQEENNTYINSYLNDNISKIDGTEYNGDITSLTSGNHEVTMTIDSYDGETTNNYKFTFNVVKDAKSAESIKVINPKTQYYTAYREDLERPEIEVTYSDGTTETIPAGTLEIVCSLDLEGYNNTSYVNDYVSQNGDIDDDSLDLTATVTVEYRGATATYDINIQKTPYESITATLDRDTFYADKGHTWNNSTWNAEYFESSYIRNVIVTKKDGTVEEYDYLYNIGNYDYYGNRGFLLEDTTYYDLSSYISNGGTTGSAKARLTYAGVSCDFDITIIDNNIDHIEVITPPSDVRYLNGSYGSPNFEGMVIRAYFDAEETDYKDYSYDEYKNYYNSLYNNATVSGTMMSEEDFDYFNHTFAWHIGGHESIGALANGEHNIHVFLGGKETTFKINVVDTVIDSLSISLWRNEFLLSEDISSIINSYTMTINVDGNTFNRWDNTYHSYVNKYGSSLEIDVPEIKETGTYDVNVSWLGQTTTVTITVYDKLIENLEIIKNPLNCTFYVGVDSEISLFYDQMEIKVTELDGTIKYYKAHYGSFTDDETGIYYNDWGELTSGGYNYSWDSSEVNWNEIGTYTVYLEIKGAKAPLTIEIVEFPYASMTFETGRDVFFVNTSNQNALNGQDNVDGGDIRNIKFYDEEGNVLESYERLYNIPNWSSRFRYGFKSNNNGIYSNVDGFISYGDGELGGNKLVLSYGPLESEVDVKIEDRTPYKIEIVNLPSRTKYIKGSDSLSLDGLVLRVYSNENTYKDMNYRDYVDYYDYATNPDALDINDVNYFNKAFVRYFDNNQNISILEKGTHQLHIAFGNKEAETTIPIEIVESVAEDFTISYKNSENQFLQNTYYYNLRSGIQMSFHIGETEYTNILMHSTEYNQIANEYSNWMSFRVLDEDGNEVSGDLTETGTYTVEVKWLGKTATTEVEVVETLLNDFTVTFREDKGTYLLSMIEEIGFSSDVYLYFNYKGTSYSDIRPYSDEYYELADQYDNYIRCSIPEINDVGEYDITFTWLGATASVKINVVDKLISDMKVVTHQNKTDYIAGYESSIDFSGIVLGITDLDGNYKEISGDTDYWYDDFVEDETYYRDYSEIDWNTPGNYTGKIYYKGLYVEIPVTVIENPIDSVVITKAPNKTTYYQPEAENYNFNLDGMEYIVNFKDGTSYNGRIGADISPDRLDYDYIEYNGQEYELYASYWKNEEYDDDDNCIIPYGENAIICKVLGYSFEVPVTIIESPIETISCIVNPEKDTYFVRDKNVDLYGAVFDITYKDGTKETISVTQHTDEFNITLNGEVFIVSSRMRTDYDEDDNEIKCIRVTFIDKYCDIYPDFFILDKTDATPIASDSVVNVAINKENPYKVFSFTPTESDTYYFYSMGDYDTYGYLCDANGNQLVRNDDYDDYSDFRISYDLTAGTTYYYVATLYNTDKEEICSFNCILDKDGNGISADDVKSFTVTDHNFKWYDFEWPGTSINLEGLSYKIELNNGYVYETTIEDEYWINASPDSTRTYDILGIPMSIQWKETSTDEEGDIYPSRTDTNGLTATYAGHQVDIIPTFNMKSPVKSIEVLHNPWENIIVNEDTSHRDIIGMIEGLKVRINYNNGQESDIVVWEDTYSEIEFNGRYINVDTSWDVDDCICGVDIWYMGAETYIDFNGVEETISVSDITLKKEPEKKEYYDIRIGQLEIKDEVDLYGAVFTVTYTDGTTTDVMINEHKSTANIGEGYTVTGKLSGTTLVMTCENLTFDVAVEIMTVNDIAGDNNLAFSDDFKTITESLTFEDNNYKVWSFVPETTESKVVYTFESANTYSYLTNANGIVVATANADGKIERELYAGTTYYYVVVEKEDREVTVNVTKEVTEEISSVVLTMDAPEVGKELSDTITVKDAEIKVESVKWNTNNSVAGSGKVYTVTAVLAPKSGYEFTTDVAATMNDAEILTKAYSADGKMTVKYTFGRTKCLVNLPTVEGYTLYDGEGTLLTDNTVFVDYKGSFTFKYGPYVENQKFTVKANGKVLTKDENVTDGYAYTITGITAETNVIVNTEEVQAPVVVTLNDTGEVYDQIAVEEGKSVSDNEKENVLPVFDSYQDENEEQFFFGWYDAVNDSNNGTGSRFTSKTTVEKSKDVYAKWGVGKFTYVYNTLLATYTIISIDEDNKMKIKLSELAPNEVSTFSLRTSSSETGSFTIPESVDFSDLTNTDIEDEEMAALLKEIGNAEIVSIGSGAIKTTDIEEIKIPNTVETIEDNAFGNSTGLNTVVIPDSVQEISAAAFEKEETGDGTEVAETINVVCSAETAQKLASSGTETAPIEVSIVNVKFSDYAYTNKEFTYGDDALQVTPVVETTVGELTTTSTDGITVTLSESCNGYFTISEPDDNGAYMITPLKATESGVEYTVTATDDTSGNTKEIALSTKALSLDSLVKDTDNRFVIEEIEDVTYNGKSQKQTVVVKDTTNDEELTENTDYTVTYSEDTTNAGTVEVTVTGIGNYSGTLESSYEIKKKEVEITTEDITVTYGETTNVKVSVNDENAELVLSENSKGIIEIIENSRIEAKKAGTTQITVSVKGNNYMHNIAVVNVTVEKADMDMSEVVFADKTVTYDGIEHFIEAENLPEGVTVEYEGNGKIDAGSYEVTAIFTVNKNYNEIPSQTVTLTINKATVDMSKVTFANKTVNYNGKEHSITAANIPSGVEVSYEGNGKVNAGTYKVTAKFIANANYNVIADKTATLTINKANVDMSKVIFASKMKS